MTSQTFTGMEQGEQKFTRSKLLFAALAHVSNRYQLCQMTAKGARKLHKSSDRMQDTVNEVLTVLDRASTVNAVPRVPRQIRLTLRTWLQSGYISDATHFVANKTVFMPEERDFSHV